MLLLVLGAAGWAYRGVWVPKAREMISARAPGASPDWAPVTKAGAGRAEARISTLGEKGGPASVTVDAADFAAWVLAPALDVIGQSDDAPKALIQGDTLFLTTRIRLADVGGKGSLGPVAQMFNETEPLLIGGRVEQVRSGLGQYRMSTVALRELKVPAAGISRLITRWGTAGRPAGLASDALPIVLPAYVGDLRIAKGRVTLTRAK
ncbi:MAG: hypothetical protein OEW77_02115 [Gemmatimonadota bacterium]|nr:hypothetical protein [Gemmatimonadota bacterium]